MVSELLSAVFFADIHKQNELNNFVLPVVVTESFLKELFEEIYKNPNMEVEVDLPKSKSYKSGNR